MTPVPQEPDDGLFFEEMRSRAGPGSPLVACVHGSMDRHTSFVRLRSRLLVACDVLVYDRRGYAGSRDALPLAPGIEEHVADLLHLLGGRRAVLLGHSYGGDVALALALRHPETVAAAVVYEPPLPWLELWRSTEAPRDGVPWMAADPHEAAERFIRHVVGDARFERIPAATRSELVKDGPALVAELASIRRQPPPFDPQLVEVPVSVVWGAESLERHRSGADWLVNSLPRATSHVLEGATHNGHRTHSKELAEIVLAAVGSAFGQPAGAGSRRSP